MNTSGCAASPEAALSIEPEYPASEEAGLFYLLPLTTYFLLLTHYVFRLLS
ncbi:hypothetical protein [Algoriphagus sp.]|uniref:hypothetical protein n=1 Tax=Algoriphagus sp. TaxID=1872435 RepID=UPI00391A7D09